MVTRVLRLCCGLLPAALLLLVAGCSTSGSGSSSGYGADAGPWPKAPQSASSENVPAQTDAPPAPLRVLLRAKMTAEETMTFEVTQADLKFEDQWVPVVKRADIGKIESLPLALSTKSAAALLADTRVPKRKYTHLRVKLGGDKPALTQEKKSWTLKLPETVTLNLDEWTPNEAAQNYLTVTLDETKATKGEKDAVLTAEAFTLSKAAPVAGISGKLIPPLPTARIEAVWGKSKIVLGSAAPAADGTFTLPQLPAGNYRLEIATPGYRQIEPLKDLVAVENKVVTLKDIQLAAETR